MKVVSTKQKKKKNQNFLKRETIKENNLNYIHITRSFDR